MDVFKNPRWLPWFQDGCHFFQNNLSTLALGGFPESFMKIGLDLAEIFTKIKRLDWHGGKGKREGEKGSLTHL